MYINLDKEKSMFLKVDFDASGNARFVAVPMKNLPLDERQKIGQSYIAEGISTVEENGTKKAYCPKYINNLTSNINLLTRIERSKENPSLYTVRIGTAVIGQIVRENGSEKFQEGVLLLASEKRSLSQGKLSEVSQEERANFVKDNIVERGFETSPKHITTDLHTHLTGCFTIEQMKQMGDEYNLQIPVSYLEEVGISITDSKSFNENNPNPERSLYDNKVECIRWNDLSEESKLKYLSRLQINSNKQQTFVEMDQIYELRSPFTLLKNFVESQELTSMNPKAQADSNKPFTSKKPADIVFERLKMIAENYQKMGIDYAELSASEITKDASIENDAFLEAISNENIKKIEEQYGVKLRFLGGISRSSNEATFTQKFNILKERSKNLSAIVGLDVMGHEINETKSFEKGLSEAVSYAIGDERGENNPFVIRVHAGESGVSDNNIEQVFDIVLIELLKSNPAKYSDVIKLDANGKVSVANGKSLDTGNLVLRIGHGLHGGLSQSAIKKAKALGAIIEIQASSNLALDNVDSISQIPIKSYIEQGVKFVLGTDGFGIYGTNAVEESLIAQKMGGKEVLDYVTNVENEYKERMQKTSTQTKSTDENKIENETSLSSLLKEAGKTQADAEAAVQNQEAIQQNESAAKKPKLHEIINAKIQESNQVLNESEIHGKIPIMIVGNMKKEWSELSESEKGNVLKQLTLFLKNIDTSKYYIEVSPFSDNGGFNDCLLKIIKNLNKQNPEKEIVTVAHIPLNKKYADLAHVSKDIKFLQLHKKNNLGQLGSDNFSKSMVKTTRNVIEAGGSVVAFGEGFAVNDVIQTAHNDSLSKSAEFNPMSKPENSKSDSLKIYKPTTSKKSAFLNGNGYGFDNVSEFAENYLPEGKTFDSSLSAEEQALINTMLENQRKQEKSTAREYEVAHQKQ